METTIQILNVTALEPRQKHPRIFEIFDALIPGTAFIIENDHDPKPLYYQMLAERGQTFNWEYLENGPHLWKVNIEKKPTGGHEETIGELVTKDYRKAQVFKSFGIDFCCGGKKTVAEVCSKKGIDETEVLNALQQLSEAAKDNEHDYRKWDIAFLADYIINTHHQYVKENTSFVMELANKVARVHGELHPETIKVAELFSIVGQDLLLHLNKEEMVLFPFIKALSAAQHNGGPLPESAFGDAAAPIQMMEAEHEHAGEILRSIREVTNNFSLPPNACNSYTILYKKLDEFENDLHKHVHLENNILFPKSLAAEQELRKTV